jgi:hypothetical protein
MNALFLERAYLDIAGDDRQIGIVEIKDNAIVINAWLLRQPPDIPLAI